VVCTYPLLGIGCDFYGTPREYISGTEPNQIRMRTRMERVLGSHLLCAVVLDCD
jgi:hypothetical protein